MATWTPIWHLSSVQPCHVTSDRRPSHACQGLTALAHKRTQPQHMRIRRLLKGMLSSSEGATIGCADRRLETRRV